MPNFAYVARTQGGEERTGLVPGGTMDEVVGTLHAQGLVVLHVAEERGRALRQSWLRRELPLFAHVSTRDLALFTRQLATVLHAGIPLIRGLRGLAADSSSKRLGRAIDDLALRIERGEGIADAMAAHPECFGKMYVSMIRAGERAGTLDNILEQLAVYLEKTDAIKTRVRSALAYPVFVLVFAVMAMLFLLFKIVPTFESIYSDMGQELPRLTRIVMDVSSAIRTHALLSLGIVVVLVLLFITWARTRSGRYAIDSFLLNVPVFGPIVRRSVMSRFARTLGILLQSGLPVLEALELVKGAADNAVVERAVDRAKGLISAGQPITTSFRATGKFPEMLLQLMGTGEEAGELDAMLLKTSDFYDRQVEAAVQALTSLIEPLMIVLVGAMIGVVVVSMFLPVFHLGEAIMKGGANL
jgi:type IV pilus assembly protein PilC